MAVFSLCTSLACAIGFFPVQRPWLSSKKFNFKWCSFSAWYSIIFLVVNTLLEIDILINKPFLYAENASLVLKLVFYGCSIMDMIISVTVKVVGIFYCGMFSSAISDLETLRKLGPTRHREWTKKGFYISMVSQAILHCKYWVTYLTSVLEPTVTVGPTTNAERLLSSISEPLMKFNLAVLLVLPTLYELSASWIVICVGMLMKGAHEAVFNLLILAVDRDYLDKIERDDVVKVLFKHLNRLKGAFKACSRVIGMYTLLIVTWFISALTYVIYVLIWTKDQAISFSDLLICVGQIMTLIFLGQALENQVATKREALKQIVVSSKLATYEHNEILYLATYATKWDWALYAGGVFKVNLACIAGFLGAPTTYTTFMVQLELETDL